MRNIRALASAFVFSLIAVCIGTVQSAALKVGGIDRTLWTELGPGGPGPVSALLVHAR